MKNLQNYSILRSTEYVLVPTPDVNNGKTWGRIQTQSFLFNAHHKYVPWNNAILQRYLRTKTEKHMKYCIFKTNRKKSSVISSTILCCFVFLWISYINLFRFSSEYIPISKLIPNICEHLHGQKWQKNRKGVGWDLNPEYRLSMKVFRLYTTNTRRKQW